MSDTPITENASTPCMRCLQLRTKMDYVLLDEGRPSGRPSEWDEDETLGGTAHNHYCLHTLTVFGPDDDLVGPRICTPERNCYESLGF
jgi:hypothetical protein